MKPVDMERSLLIEPAAIERYLRNTGWSEQVSSTARATVWKKPGNRKRGFEVLVPRSAAYADYPVRISELVAVLEQAEGRPQEDILWDLRSSSGALVTLRARLETPEQVNIRLVDGIALATAGFHIVAAAARAAADRVVEQPVWRAKLVNSFVGDVRLAPAEPGSYLMPLLLPSDVAYATHAANFGSVVKRELEAALDQVQTYASQDALDAGLEYLRPAETAIWNALAALADEDGVTSLSIELDATFESEHESARRVFMFDHPALQRLRDASPAPGLRPAAGASRTGAIGPADETRRYGVELTGQVIRLERHTVAVRTALDGRPRTVRVLLPSDADYERAIDAHRRRIDVVCGGALVLRGSSARLEDVYLFDLVD